MSDWLATRLAFANLSFFPLIFGYGIFALRDASLFDFVGIGLWIQQQS
jgi:hypothetical protein